MLYRAHSKCFLNGASGVLFNPYMDGERRPLNTPNEIHEVANKWFKDKFGIAFRSRAIFCSGSLSLVNDFMSENSFLISIKPIGEYNLCYSRLCADFTPHFNVMRDYLQGDLNQAVIDELESLNYIFMENEGLDSAASSGCEVMLYANSFQYEVIG